MLQSEAAESSESIDSVMTTSDWREDKYRKPIFLQSVERFHSLAQPCTFIGTKGTVYIKELNSDRIVLGANVAPFH